MKPHGPQVWCRIWCTGNAYMLTTMLCVQHMDQIVTTQYSNASSCYTVLAIHEYIINSRISHEQIIVANVSVGETYPKPEIQIELIDGKCWDAVFTTEFTNLDYWKQLFREDYRTFAFLNSETLRKVFGRSIIPSSSNHQRNLCYNTVHRSINLGHYQQETKSTLKLGNLIVIPTILQRHGQDLGPTRDSTVPPS